ncbi:MAG: hypothetical protein IKM84_07055 [Oscillospiraceae bacterium]|nr:hypothetical protein [Oscillospiraceae bacterium]
MDKKKPTNERYINCDQLCEFPKTTYYKKLSTRNRLKELRDAIELIHVGKKRQYIVDGKAYEIKNYGSVSAKQRQNRRNPEYHQKLQNARLLQELAIMQNDRNKAEDYAKIVDELNHKLGYRDRATHGKYKIQLKDTVTNPKPFRGGSCIPK